LNTSDKEAPSDKEAERILAQWKTCVEMADSVSRRRDTMNHIFISLNLALAVSGTAFSGNSQGWIILPLAGIIFCLFWSCLLCTYRQLNSAKFDVIIDIESRLPEQPFTDEWKKLNCKYKELTNLEQILPIGFIILYSAEIVRWALNLCLKV